MSVFLQPIYTQTVGAGGASSITFNNIPQTFTDLKIVMSGRSSSSTADAFFMRIGTSGSIDNAAHYSSTRLFGNGSSDTSDRYSGKTETFYYASMPIAGSTANTFNNAEIYIPNYTSSNYKQILLDNVAENNSASTYIEQDLMAGLWQNSGSVTNILFASFDGGNFVQYSTFSLYGVLQAGI
jgi:hypothetical protein